MLLILHPHSHGHGHGHSHSHSHSHSQEKPMHNLTEEGQSKSKVEDEGKSSGRLNRNSKPLRKHRYLANINVKAAFIHVIGDLFQSVGVVIAGYIIWFKVYSTVS